MMPFPLTFQHSTIRFNDGTSVDDCDGFVVWRRYSIDQLLTNNFIGPFELLFKVIIPSVSSVMTCLLRLKAGIVCQLAWLNHNLGFVCLRLCRFVN
jgi:hypothetical protein